MGFFPYIVKCVKFSTIFLKIVLTLFEQGDIVNFVAGGKYASNKKNSYIVSQNLDK